MGSRIDMVFSFNGKPQATVFEKTQNAAAFGVPLNEEVTYPN